MIKEQTHLAPPLTEQFYAEAYELRKAASTMTPTTIGWFQRQARQLLQREPDSDKTFTVLSVGSGEGDIDLEIIAALMQHLAPRWAKLHYIALEPNPEQRMRFEQRLAEMTLDPRVQVTVRDQPIQKLHGQHQQYDLVLFVHVFYYFAAPQQIIADALQMAKACGQVVIVHQTPIGIPEIQQQYMEAFKGDVDEMFTTDDIRALLNNAATPYQYEEIPAYLDVTECLQETEAGLEILSFCMECDLRCVDYAPILNAVREMAEFQPNNRARLHEPIGIFTLTAPHIADSDPVEDYRQLARRIDWGKLLSYASHRTTPVRVLDVGCGTGRWLNALHHYVPLATYLNGSGAIAYDVLDPSATAILQLERNLRAPFQLGERYVTTMQKATLPTAHYDIIWSNHAFYAMPVPHLPSILANMQTSLKETGVGLIAMPNRRSFYVQFFAHYLTEVHGGQGDGFTSAESITDELTALGIPYQVQTICYHERIPKHDAQALAHYIINEATINSFSKDEDMIDLPISRALTLTELYEYQPLRQFIDTYGNGVAYYFPQEVKVIAFGDLAAVSSLNWDAPK